MADRPNVIVIVSDTLRPDHLGCNGHPVCRTPELDEWFSKAIVFDQARVSSFPTIPMRTDWFTGRFSHLRHGWQNLDPAEVTLTHVLKQAGYTTQLLADTTHLLRADFWRPFHSFHFLRGHESDKPVTRLNEPIPPVVSDRAKTRVETRMTRGDEPTLSDQHSHTNWWRRYESETHIAQLTEEACRWLETNYRGGPFFLWLDCFDVHEPWHPPEYLLRSYQAEYDGEPMVHPNYGDAAAYSPAELENLNAHYRGMVTLLSKQLGRVLTMIEEMRLLENSIVVFMSDHGMYLGERGRTGKTLIQPRVNDTFPFHCELSNIVWTMHLPPLLGTDNGRRLDTPIQAPDLMPTLLSLLELPIPDAVEGEDLSPVLRGERSSGSRPVHVTCSTTAVAGVDGPVFCRHPAVSDGEWVLLLSEPPEPAPPRLYRLADDRVEAHDRMPTDPAQARRLHKALLAWLTQQAAPAAAIERLSATNCGLS